MQKLLTGVFLLFFILLSSVAHSQDSDEIRWKRCPGSNKQCPQVIDANLKKCIAYFAKKPFEELLVEDYLRVTFLGCSNRGIIDITGIENFTNLIELNLETNEISDIRPLSYLASLEKLYLSGNQISDITPVAGLTKMKELHFAANQVEDIGPLAELVQLELLVFDNNQVNDLSPLKGLTRLLWLDFPNNPSGDLSSIANLRSLEYLDASENYISDISMLKNLKELDNLYLRNNEISDISVLVNFKKLLRIGLQKNNIRDTKSLAGLKSIRGLNLGNNQINDISSMAKLNELRVVDLSANSIDNIAPLRNLINLKRLTLDNNLVGNVSLLAGLSLDHVSLLNNCIKNVGALADVKSVTGMEYQHNLCSSPNLVKRVITKEWLAEQTGRQCVDYDGKNDYSLKSDYTYGPDGIYYEMVVRNNLGRESQLKACRLPWNSNIEDILVSLDKMKNDAESYEVLGFKNNQIYAKNGRLKGYSVTYPRKVAGGKFGFLDGIFEIFGVRYTLKKQSVGGHDTLIAEGDGHIFRIVDMGEKYSVQFFEPGFYAAEISKQQ